MACEREHLRTLHKPIILQVNEMTERLTLLENELAEKQTTAEEMYRLR